METQQTWGEVLEELKQFGSKIPTLVNPIAEWNYKNNIIFIESHPLNNGYCIHLNGKIVEEINNYREAIERYIGLCKKLFQENK